MFIRLVKVRVAAGREHDLYRFWEWASARAQQQPGYMRGCLWQSTADPQQFLELHQWARQEDSSAYRSSAQFQEVMQRLLSIAQNEPAIEGYQNVYSQAQAPRSCEGASVGTVKEEKP